MDRSRPIGRGFSFRNSAKILPAKKHARGLRVKLRAGQEACFALSGLLFRSPLTQGSGRCAASTLGFAAPRLRRWYPVSAAARFGALLPRVARTRAFGAGGGLVRWAFGPVLLVAGYRL